MQNLFYPSLHIIVDGELILGPEYCTGVTYLPSSYTIQFTSPGNHTIKFMLTTLVDNGTPCGERVKVESYELSVNVKFQISIENIFGGGSIYADGYRTSPFRRISAAGDNVVIGAIEQDYNNYHWIWNNNGVNNSEWIRKPSGSEGIIFSNVQYTSYSVQGNDINTRVIAGLRKLCNVTFQNNFVSVGNGGTIKVNGQKYSSPTTQFQVVDGNTITAEAQYYYFLNGIEYTFTNWSDGSTTRTKTFTINAHNQITANYRGKPTNSGEYVHFGTQVGQPIEVLWNDNPNPNVTQYQIWRKVKHNGVVGPEQLIGTVGRGVGRFVDYDYVLTSSYTNDLLMYDVRAYYSVEGTYSDPNYVSIYGAESLRKKGGEIKPVEYSMEVYPNPFNPSTTINYQLPEKSLVTIKIYDMLGREVKELINDLKEAGYYKLEFDGNELSSGIYICTINANKFSKSIKLMLVK
ncbi:MAG: T9SS type A sorting domain-containing protein [Melioribacteraceae bacterium]